jgi:hypothetical protein
MQNSLIEAAIGGGLCGIRGDTLELVEEGMARVVDQLRGWSRLIHKVAQLREPGE